MTSLAVVGENTVVLLDGRAIGLTTARGPVGSANEALRKQIFEKLGRTK